MSEQEFDYPPETGHAIPMWLRRHFDELEIHATHMSGASVFTQMRTKVQAYFELLRAAENGWDGWWYGSGIELECLRVDADRFQFIANDAESTLEKIYGDDWLAAVDYLRCTGEK